MKRINAMLFLIILLSGCNAAKINNIKENKHVSLPSTTTIKSTVKTTIPIEKPTNLALNTPINIPKINLLSDKDRDGINDLDDIIEGARKDAENRPTYFSKYYQGGYPPENEGVCTDVIWRSFKNAGYNLKDMVDTDIKLHTSDYPGVNGEPDKNIDFRRVQNLLVFFNKYSTKLTTKLEPNSIKNLIQWQGGDIVCFSNPDHIAVISDIRREDGVPYLIHNSGPYTMESDSIMLWMDGITGHFRFPKD